MFLYKSDPCGLIVDVKWPLGAFDKNLVGAVSAWGFLESGSTAHSPCLSVPLLLC